MLKVVSFLGHTNHKNIIATAILITCVVGYVDLSNGNNIYDARCRRHTEVNVAVKKAEVAYSRCSGIFTYVRCKMKRGVN